MKRERRRTRKRRERRRMGLDEWLEGVVCCKTGIGETRDFKASAPHAYSRRSRGESGNGRALNTYPQSVHCKLRSQYNINHRSPSPVQYTTSTLVNVGVLHQIYISSDVLRLVLLAKIRSHAILLRISPNVPDVCQVTRSVLDCCTSRFDTLNADAHCASANNHIHVSPKDHLQGHRMGTCMISSR